MSQNGHISPLKAPAEPQCDLMKFKNHSNVLPKVHHYMTNRSDGVFIAIRECDGRSLDKEIHMLLFFRPF